MLSNQSITSMNDDLNVAQEPINITDISNITDNTPDTAVLTINNNQTALTANQSALLTNNDRPGLVVVAPIWLSSPVLVPDFFVAALGAIVHLASFPASDDLTDFLMNIQGSRSCISVRTAMDSLLNYRVQDAVDGVVDLATTALQERRFFQVLGKVRWMTDDAVYILGYTWIYNKPEGGHCKDVTELQQVQEVSKG